MIASAPRPLNCDQGLDDLLADLAEAIDAAAPSLPSNCQQASVGAEVTCSFGYTGSEQTFTVPGGVSDITLTATGASGGSVGGGTGGLGGVATGAMKTLDGGQAGAPRIGRPGIASGTRLPSRTTKTPSTRTCETPDDGRVLAA